MTTFIDRVARQEIVPYVYNYPPTRTYQMLSSFSMTDLALTPRINVYIHIPFCEQKCTFCGYLTVIDLSKKSYAPYVDAVCQELRLCAAQLAKHDIATINFGGGTPSLLAPEELGKILATIRSINPRAFETATEVSIEATPETINREKFLAYRKLGLNRVSVGIQTLDDAEIRRVKRHNLADVSVQALSILAEIGFKNICVDLMYGLPGQTFESFQASVESVLAYHPTTVELYGTVIIPGTALAQRGNAQTDSEKLRCYDYARQRFIESGYRQDCHLRFALPGGGYDQQANVFALESLLGFGVGARSYTENLHYRNVYDTGHSRDALRRYIDRVSHGLFPVEQGVVLSTSELERRYVVHQLEHLDENDFHRRFGRTLEEAFPQEVALLTAERILRKENSIFSLVPDFFRYRDLIAREFFSPAVRGTESTYYTEPLHTIRLSK